MEDVARFLLDHWDVITLVVTNIAALFVQSPIKKVK